MSQPTTYTTSYRFDNFYLDARNRRLWRDEADRVAVEPGSYAAFSVTTSATF